MRLRPRSAANPPSTAGGCATSDGGARHWAVAMTLIQTAKLNGVDPMAWLTDVLERIVSNGTKAHELHMLLPWTWAEAQANSDATALAA